MVAVMPINDHLILQTILPEGEKVDEDMIRTTYDEIFSYVQEQDRQAKQLHEFLSGGTIQQSDRSAFLVRSLVQVSL